MFPLTDLCIYGQFQQIRRLQSLYWDPQVEQSGVHPQLGVHLHYAHGGTCDLLCNTTPEGHDCDIMVGLLPWDPGMQHWPANRNWNLALDVQVAASWQSGRADAATNKDSSSFIVSSDKTLSRDVKGFLDDRFVSSRV